MTNGKLTFCYKNHAAIMNFPESPAPRNTGGRPKGDEPTKVGASQKTEFKVR